MILKRGHDIQKVGARKNKKGGGDLEKFGLDQEEEPLWSKKIKKKIKTLNPHFLTPQPTIGTQDQEFDFLQTLLKIS